MHDSPAVHKLGIRHPNCICARVKVTQREIASLIKCSTQALQTALANYTFDTFKGLKSCRNYERITTKDEDKVIKNTLKHNSVLPLRDITNLLPVKISETTLRRRRTEFGLGSYIAAKKPGLCPENVEARLCWALEHVNWNLEDWKHVIWSDESSIWVGVNPQRQWVISPPGERFNRKYVKKTFKSTQMKVMMWTCFTGNRLGPMIICDEDGIGANEYEDTLYDELFSLINDLLAIPDDVEEVQVANENAYVFMQDNACCHKVNDVLEFLQENNVPLMEWPAQSPDLNPIENLRSDFKE